MTGRRRVAWIGGRMFGPTRRLSNGLIISEDCRRRTEPVPSSSRVRYPRGRFDCETVFFELAHIAPGGTSCCAYWLLEPRYWNPETTETRCVSERLAGG